MSPKEACAAIEATLCRNYNVEFCSVALDRPGSIRAVLACNDFLNEPMSIRVEHAFMLLKWAEREVFQHYVVVVECYSSEEMTRALFHLTNR